MRISQMILGLREIIEPKLIYSPFLRLVIFNVWFQLGFAAVLLTLLSAALYLPKMWRVSPKGFEPVIKVSGLDLTQNWSLKRTARQLEEAGDFPKAAEAWKRAVAENASDREALHGYLNAFQQIRRPDQQLVAAAVGQMQWLLRMYETNRADLERVARVCDRVAWHDLTMYFLKPFQEQPLPPGAEAALIKSLFHQGRIADFDARLEKNGAGLSDPELAYYRLARRAGWESGTDPGPLFEELGKIAADPLKSARAGSLILLAAAERRDLTRYARELDRLAARDEARAADHARYWALLAESGRSGEAVKLAESVSLTPETGADVLRLAQSYVALGLVENARELLKSAAPSYRHYPEIWLTYTGVLEARQEWEELRAAARLIRQDGTLRERVWGLSYFMEGRADLGQKRDAAAESMFAQAAASTFENPELGALVARELLRFKHPKHALAIYEGLEPALENNAAYWAGVFEAAFAVQDAAMLLKATEQIHRLDPKDPMAASRYSAALLLNRTRPEEAIHLTLHLRQNFPNSTAAAINHGVALLLNHRMEEARQLLESIDASALSAIETAPYHFALFETYHGLKLWDLARKAREKVADGALFPVQRARLAELDAAMPKQLAGKS